MSSLRFFAVSEELLAGNYSAFRTALCGEAQGWGGSGFRVLVTRFNDSTFLDFDSSRGRKEWVQVAGRKGVASGQKALARFLSAVKITKCFSCIPFAKPEKSEVEQKKKREKKTGPKGKKCRWMLKLTSDGSEFTGRAKRAKQPQNKNEPTKRRTKSENQLEHEKIKRQVSKNHFHKVQDTKDLPKKLEAELWMLYHYCSKNAVKLCSEITFYGE